MRDCVGMTVWVYGCDCMDEEGCVGVCDCMGEEECVGGAASISTVKYVRVGERGRESVWMCVRGCDCGRVCV